MRNGGGTSQKKKWRNWSEMDNFEMKMPLRFCMLPENSLVWTIGKTRYKMPGWQTFKRIGGILK